MKTKDVLDYFHGQVKTAEVLGISQPAVSNWGEYPPEGRQCRIELITDGKLKAEKRTKAVAK